MSLFKSTKQSENCPQCGAVLQIKRSKQGLFFGCSAYPQCDYIKPLQQSSHIIKTLEEACPECGHFLQLKQGSFGMFIGCSDYPNCHFIVSEAGENEAAFECPECKKHSLVKRQGRSGRTFYGCGGYPQCKFTVTGELAAQHCPECDYALAVHKRVKGKLIYQCANKQCRAVFELKEQE